MILTMIAGIVMLLAGAELAGDAPLARADGMMAPANDPVAAAASGLIAQIEDDVNPGGDTQLAAMKTDGCTTIISGLGASGERRDWTINWSVPGSLGPGDTFIFIDVAPVKIAIVGDASKPDQAAKLSALFDAMFETQLDCSTQF